MALVEAIGSAVYDCMAVYVSIFVFEGVVVVLPCGTLSDDGDDAFLEGLSIGAGFGVPCEG